MINPWRWVDPRIKEVRLAGLRRYLTSRGWEETTASRPDYLGFLTPPKKSSARLGPLVVPGSEEFDDFTQRITEFLTILSELESRHPVQILEDVLAAQATDDSAPRPKATERRA